MDDVLSYIDVSNGAFDNSVILLKDVLVPNRMISPGKCGICNFGKCQAQIGSCISIACWIL